MAQKERDGPTIAAYHSLARSYERLAEQADSNARIDITYEPPIQNELIIVKPPEVPEPTPITPQDETPDSEII